MCWQLITLLTVWIYHGLCLVILKLCKSTQEMSGFASHSVWSFDMECWPQTMLLFISCLWHLAIWKDEGRDSQQYFEQIQTLLVHGDRRVVCLFSCQPWEVNYWVLHMNSILRVIPAHLIVLCIIPVSKVIHWVTQPKKWKYGGTVIQNVTFTDSNFKFYRAALGLHLCVCL